MQGPDRVVVLAGGGGTRLWPWTGPELPKPLLPLGGRGRTLLDATLDRVRDVVSSRRLAILAAPELLRQFAAARPELQRDQLWAEPAPRDTAAAVALAMRRILLEDPAAVAAVLPADHRIADESRFCEALGAAAAGARAGRLVLLGVAPDHPSTRFGYLELGAPVSGGPSGLVHVQRFVEKPPPAAAEKLMRQGALWNAGMFVWRADVFWEALERHAPGIAAAAAAFMASGDPCAWERAERTSIDYALLERAHGVAAVRLDAGWDDVGGWEAVAALAAAGDAGPLVQLELKGEGADGTVVLGVAPAAGERAVALDAAGLLVVVGPRGVLVTRRTAAHRVKEYAD